MLISSFLDYLRTERNYSSYTVCSYGEDLKQFSAFLQRDGHEKDLLQTSSGDIRQWVVFMLKEGYTVVSVKRKISALRSFFKYQIKKQHLVVDPSLKVKIPKQAKKLPTFVKECEMDRLIDDVPFSDDFVGVRDRLIIETFYMTGMRLSELINLKDEDVDFYANVLKVTGKRNKQRMVPFSDAFKASLKKYLDYRDDLMMLPEAFFVREGGEKLYPSKVYEIVKTNLSKVATLKKRSPHVLRHTFATMMLNHGADLNVVKELLGHESLSSTEIYTHTTFEELKKEYKQAHPRA